MRRNQRSKVELDLPKLFFRQHEIIGSTMGSGEEFAAVTAAVADGLAVPVADELALEDYPTGLDRLRQGEQLGKLVLRH